jgi:hypothetical protein
MKLVLNNVQFIYDWKIQLVICTWAVIEILQNTKFASNFFVMHLSSFFGAIVFLYFIDYFKKNKWLKITPIIIEILHSLFFQGVVDIEDVLFSFTGIIIYYLVFTKKLFSTK